MKSAPKAPDANKTAATQNMYNKQAEQRQLAYNRVNQTDPFGNTLAWSQTGTDAQGNPMFSVSQGLGGIGQQYAGGLSGLGQQYFGTAGQGAPDSMGAFNKAYDLATANLEPRFQRAQGQLYTQLRNQGLTPGTEAWSNSMNDLALQQNEARNSLVSGLQSQMFNQGLQGRQQQLAELQPGLQFANNALNPSYASVPGVGVSPIDYAGLRQQQYQGDVNAYNAQNQMYGGLASIGSGLMGFL